MSTAFYVTAPETNLLKVMGRSPHRQLVGKRSAGWTFTFHGNRERGIKDFASWRENLLALLGAGGELISEYGTPVGFDELMLIIEGLRSNKNQNAVLYPQATECFLDADGNDFCEGEWS